MKKYLMTITMIFASFSVYAGNPGQSAQNCISASTKADRYNDYRILTFRNRCNFNVFVLWCGDLQYSKKRCGDGPRNSYYTQSANIAPHGKNETTIRNRGSYRYAACKGKIGWGSKGIVHPANSGGSFRCTRT